MEKMPPPPPQINCARTQIMEIELCQPLNITQEHKSGTTNTG